MFKTVNKSNKITKRNVDDFQQEKITNKKVKHESYQVKNFIKNVEYVNQTNKTLCKIVNFCTDDIIEIITYFMKNKTSNNAFYIVNLSEIIRLYNLWTSKLPRVKPFYAIKSNSDPMIAKILADMGCGFDCASKEEIKQVLNLGVDPKNIIYANPVKQNEYISYARNNNIEIMVFDSETELYKIKLLHPNSKLVLRIKVDDSASICKFNCKFGCFDEEIEALLQIAKILELDVCGISFHLGSNLQKAGFFNIAIKKARDAINIAEKTGHICNILDIGGGFSSNGSGISFQDTALEINKALDEYFGDILGRINIYGEPGRFFSNSSHTLLTSVIGIRSTESGQDKKFIYTINESIYQSFNCLIFDHVNPEIFPYDGRHQKKKYKTDIVGNTCDGMDLLKNDIMLPELSVGDFIYVPNFGSYTRAASTTFNGFKLANIYYYTTD